MPLKCPAQVINLIDDFNRGKRPYTLMYLFSQFFFLIAIAGFFTLFFGFINIMPGMSAFLVIKGFFILVGGIVIVTILFKNIKILLTEQLGLPVPSSRWMLASAIALAVGIILVATLIGSFYLGSPDNFSFFIRYAVGIGIITGSVILANVLKMLAAGYAKRYKNEMMPLMVSDIDPSAAYENGGHLSMEILKNSGFFAQMDMAYVKGSDLIVGTSTEKTFRLSQIRIFIRKEDSKGRKSVAEDFRGIVMMFDFKRELEGRILGYSDTAREMAGSLIGESLNKLAGVKSKHIYLENETFEKYFNVYTTDELEGRFILSPVMQEALADFRKAINREMRFSFVNRRFFVFIPVPFDYFQPKLLGKFDEKVVNGRLQLLYALLQLPKLLVANSRLMNWESQ